MVPAHGERGGMVLPPANLAAGPDASSLLKALKRRWLLALCLGTAAAAGGAAAGWFLLTPKHTAFALLRFESGELTVIPRERHEGHGDFATYLKTQAARIKGRHVLNEALRNEDVRRLNMVRQQPEIIPWLEEEIKIELQENSEIAKVSMTGPDPDELVTMLGGVTTAFVAETLKAEKAQRLKRIDELEKILNEKHAELDQLRTSLHQAEDKTGLAGFGLFNQQFLLLALSDLRRQLGGAQRDHATAERQLNGLKGRLQALDEWTPPEGDIETALEADPSVKKLADKKLRAQEEVDYYARNFKGGNTMHRLWQNELSSLAKRLEERRAEARTRLVERIRKEVRSKNEAVIKQLEEELEPLQSREDKLVEKVKELEGQVARMGSSTAEIDKLRAEIKNTQGMVDKVEVDLNTRRAELDLPPRVELYQPAAMQKKDIKRQLLAAIGLPVAALVTVCLCIGWWEYRARRIHSADEVVDGLGLRLVGTVPPLPQLAQGRFAAASFEPGLAEHNLLESIDGIRTVLLRDAHVAATRVVMVTSARSGEGKTTLAGHLAISLARAGRRTLLIDSDLRRPAAHQLFEQTLQPGLSEVLLNEIDLAGAVRPTTAMDGLCLLPAGQWDREVLKALAQESLQRVFERLRKEYDFIVVDSSPVLAANDSLLVGQHVDGVILSLMRDVSQVPTVYAAAQRLTSLGIRVLGAVVNGLVPEGMEGHHYPYSQAGASRPAAVEQA